MYEINKVKLKNEYNISPQTQKGNNTIIFRTKKMEAF